MTGGIGPDMSGPDVELLAGLAAAEHARLRATADPATAEVLDALAATRAELAALPVPPMPPDLWSRCAAALQTEAQHTKTPGTEAPGTEAREPDPETLPPSERTALSHEPIVRKCRSFGAGGGVPGVRMRAVRTVPQRAGQGRARWGVRALLAAVLASAALVGGLVPAARPGEPIELAAAGRSALGSADLGPLSDPVRRAGCLRAAGVPGVAAGAPVLGGRRVVLAGRPGRLLVFATGQLGVFRVVVVDPDCGPAGGTLLHTLVIGD